MSRSRKKAIVKDIGHRKREYWRVHRRVNRQLMRTNISDSEFELKSPKELINDYDYCDWIFNAEYGSWNNTSRQNEYRNKWRRK